jgi:hypothetical protein
MDSNNREKFEKGVIGYTLANAFAAVTDNGNKWPVGEDLILAQRIVRLLCAMYPEREVRRGQTLH